MIEIKGLPELENHEDYTYEFRMPKEGELFLPRCGTGWHEVSIDDEVSFSIVANLKSKVVGK